VFRSLPPGSPTRNASPTITTPIVPTPASPLKAIHPIKAAKVVTIEITIEPVMAASIKAAKVVTIEIAIEPLIAPSVNARPKESVVPKDASIHSWATTIPAAIARVMSVNEPKRLFLKTSTMPASLCLRNARRNQRASQSNQCDCQEFLHSSHDPSSFLILLLTKSNPSQGEIRS
jgi:hypothetical protein